MLKLRLNALATPLFSLFVLLSSVVAAQGQVTVGSPLRTAVENCLSQAVNARPTQIGKKRHSGTTQVSIAVTCGRNDGKVLYDSIKPYAVERGPEKNDTNQTVIYRFFGEAQCVRWVADSAGASMEDYWCFINLNLGEAAKAAM